MKSSRLNEELNTSPEDNLDREEIIIKEIESIKPITRDMQVIQTFVEDPFQKEEKKNVILKDPFQDWSFDQPKRKCRLFTFKDLWNNNYLLSEGSKFGGDFLVSSGLTLFESQIIPSYVYIVRNLKSYGI